MKRLSDTYLEQQLALHALGYYGLEGQKWAVQVEDLAQAMNTTDILDYACGSGTLAKSLPELPIREYDPCVVGKDVEPIAADLVICTDVLEHIEPEFIDDVLDHIKSLTKRIVMFTIDLQPANKTLPDGRNAHILLRSPRWWTRKINHRFEIRQYQFTDENQRKIFVISAIEGEA